MSSNGHGKDRSHAFDNLLIWRLTTLDIRRLATPQSSNRPLAVFARRCWTEAPFLKKRHSKELLSYRSAFDRTRHDRHGPNSRCMRVTPCALSLARPSPSSSGHSRYQIQRDAAGRRLMLARHLPPGLAVIGNSMSERMRRGRMWVAQRPRWYRIALLPWTGAFPQTSEAPPFLRSSQTSRRREHRNRSDVRTYTTVKVCCDSLPMDCDVFTFAGDPTHLAKGPGKRLIISLSKLGQNREAASGTHDLTDGVTTTSRSGRGCSPLKTDPPVREFRYFM